jgi:hypothetical protein
VDDHRATKALYGPVSAVRVPVDPEGPPMLPGPSKGPSRASWAVGRHG